MITLLRRILDSLTPDELKTIKNEIEESLDEGVHDISEKGIKFLAVREGYYKHLYNDIAGHCTVGFGHLLHHGRCNQNDYKKWWDGITKKEALILMKKKLKKYITTVNKGLKVSQNQNQFDALVIFCYNIGQTGFSTSSCLRKINKRKLLEKIEARWKVWNKARDPKTKEKKISKGLINRRKKEWDLYNKGRYGNLNKMEENYERQV